MTGSLKTIRLADWPELDRQLWFSAIRPATLLDNSGPASSWRDQTLKTVAANYGQWLSWLHAIGAFDPLLDPAARCTRDRLRDYIKDLSERCRPKTVLSRVLNLERALAVLSPSSDRRYLKAAICNLPEGHDKLGKRARLQEAVALVDLGHQLMDRARKGCYTSQRKTAAVFRDGLQIALLALRPLRLKNFHALELERHLTIQNGQWDIIVPGQEVKNYRDIEVSFPGELLDPLGEYLNTWRPLLAADRYAGDRLWVSYLFRPQSASGLVTSVIRRTDAAFGRSISPQLFRDCVATSLAVHDPEIVNAASAILGNSIAVCQRYYNQAHTLQAGRSLNSAINNLRSPVKKRS